MRSAEGRTDASASAQLGIDQGGLAYWVAAVRECFEEAGLLLARPAGQGAAMSSASTTRSVAARFDVHRTAVDSGARRLVDVCLEEGLELAVDTIHYFSHWITPLGAPRRYDTRFFVARAPEAQVGLHDDREVIANLWIRPADALDRHHAGEFELIFPTIRSLEVLQRFETVDAALAAAAAIETVPAILPRIVAEPEGGFRIALPGDPGYAEADLPSDLPTGPGMNRLVGHGRLDPADVDAVPSAPIVDEREPS